MSILYDDSHRTLTLHTGKSTYQMQIGPLGLLLHLYYGPRSDSCFDYLYRDRDCGFSPNPYELRFRRGFSPDLLPQEFSGSDSGDYRLSSAEVRTEEGLHGAAWRYVSHEIRPGKYSLEGLPAAFAREEDGAETLSVLLRDAATGLEAELLYGVFPAADVITRAVRYTNRGGAALWLEKAASVCLDVPFGDWDLIRFHGRHTMERQPERTPLAHGIQTASSLRGASGHQMNPFTILCGRETTEDRGACYGVMPLYSGSHRTDVELDQTGSVRVVAGIQSEGFRWKLAPGACFTAPEVLLAYSGAGLTGLSHCLHRFLRQNLCRSRRFHRRSVLLNNWEATYFDFNTDRLLDIAREAAALGVELFVLDDGWFGTRNTDGTGLGDWFVNEEKLPGGLDPLISAVNAMGLEFGLWVEPEMVSEDSALYREHPDWILSVPGRPPVQGREQFVLDLSRPDVVNWLYETLAGLLRRHNIRYLKWDMNRSLTDKHSAALPADRQGETAHRYLLGVYALTDRLTREFPEVLLEGCAGGGGRFDAGMLAWCPQIWCSDNTDALERIAIQYGTSFGYPISAIGAHVSAVPNHQTGRSTPLGLRGMVAMCGGFGYELDPGALTEEERAEIRRQIGDYHRFFPLVMEGDYYRLSGPPGASPYAVWEFAAADGSEALLMAVMTHPAGNPNPLHVTLKGLDPAARYRLAEASWFGCLPPTALPEEAGRVFSGSALACGGFTLPQLFGDYPCARLHFVRVDGVYTREHI